MSATPSNSRPTATVRRVCAVSAIAVACATTLAAVPAASTVTAPAEGVFLAPYYTELDLTADRQVTTDDLDVVAGALGSSTGDEAFVAEADVDEDGEITVADLAEVSTRMIYDDGPFELIEADVVSMQAAMNAGVTSSVELTEDYLARIEAYDTTVVDPSEGGRELNSVIATSDVALEAAAQADAIRAEQGMTSMLLGVPVGVKDNYNTYDMPTTGGAGAWEANQTDSDATMVEGLRADGAIILAKLSLDEFAYGFNSQFSAGQPAGETLYVASPYNTAYTAGGSSGGTGAAIAANLAGIGFGTDTGGSIRVPSSYNQLVGVRPTVGLASRSGIIPLALSQDTGGPMTRSVTDAAVAMDAVVGVDEADPITENQAGLVPESYTAYLDEGALEGARIGYVASMLGSNPTTTRLWEEAKATFEAQGATVVEVEAPEGFGDVLGEGSGSTNEFRHDLEEYVADFLAPEVEARTINEIIETGMFVTSRQGTYERRAAVTAEEYEAWAGPGGSHTAQLAEGKVLVHQMLADADLDALVYPSGNPYGTQSTNLRLGPNTGMPSVTVPMGQAIESDGTITGAGVNLEFLGADFSEGELLGITYAFEQATQARTTPALYPALD